VEAGSSSRHACKSEESEQFKSDSSKVQRICMHVHACMLKNILGPDCIELYRVEKIKLLKEGGTRFRTLKP